MTYLRWLLYCPAPRPHSVSPIPSAQAARRPAAHPRVSFASPAAAASLAANSAASRTRTRVMMCACARWDSSFRLYRSMRSAHHRSFAATRCFRRCFRCSVSSARSQARPQSWWMRAQFWPSIASRRFPFVCGRGGAYRLACGSRRSALSTLCPPCEKGGGGSCALSALTCTVALRLYAGAEAPVGSPVAVPEYIVHHVRKAVAAAARCRHLRARSLVHACCSLLAARFFVVRGAGARTALRACDVCCGPQLKSVTVCSRVL